MSHAASDKYAEQIKGISPRARSEMGILVFLVVASCFNQTKNARPKDQVLLPFKHQVRSMKLTKPRHTNLTRTVNHHSKELSTSVLPNNVFIGLLNFTL